MARDKEEQEKQRDYIRQTDNILSFQGPSASFAIQQGVQMASFVMAVLPDISASGYTRREGFLQTISSLDYKLWKGLIFDILQIMKNRSDGTKSYIHHIAIQSLSLRLMRMHMYIYFTEESYTLQGQYSTFNIDTLYYKCSFFLQKVIDH